MCGVTDMPDITGVWRLRSYSLKNLETGELFQPYGDRPDGVLILLPEGRMVALTHPSDRKPPETEADQADIFRRMLAYSGPYRLEPPDRFVTTVDVAWNPLWIGSEQARTFTLDGDSLNVVSSPSKYPPAGDALVVGILSWVREKVS